jgi:peptidoglycan/LPS O-acetylase OafA/YrhL
VTPGERVSLSRDFPGLDWLRAVGAIAVLTTHVAFQTGEYFRLGTIGTVLARLDVGVALFFVLSGFLLSRQWWVREELSLPAPGTRRYARKRVLRIAPVYLVTALVGLSVVPGNDPFGWSWLPTLLLADPYVDDTLPYGLTQMWSLSVEVAFYVLLPLLMWVARKRFRDIALAGPVLVAMVLLNVAWVVTIAPAIDDARDWAPQLWVPGYLTWFAAGMWLSRVHVRQQSGRPTGAGRLLAQLGAQPGACWAAAAGLLLVAATPVAGPVSLESGTISQALVKLACYAAIAALLVIPGVWADPRGGLMRRVSRRLPRHLGHVSYSIFCVHLIVLSVVQQRRDYELFSGDFLQMWVIVLVLTLVVSEVLYWSVERPAMRWGERGRGSKRTHAPSAEHASSTR